MEAQAKQLGTKEAQMFDSQAELSKISVTQIRFLWGNVLLCVAEIL